MLNSFSINLSLAWDEAKMIRLLKHCLLVLSIEFVVTIQLVRVENIEMNNKCTYSASKRILNCAELENVDENIGQFITSRTQMLFLRNSKKISFRLNHHTDPNYSNLISYQILNSQYFSADSGAFLGLSNVQYMEFHGNNWKEIDDNIFEGLRNLEVLNLANNQINKLDRYSFHHLKKLKTLDLSDNALEIIPSNVFEELVQLESLYINSNNINTIQENALLGLSLLNLLYLTNNSMEYIDANEFNKLENIEHLNVNFNKIKSIVSQLSLPKLKFLQISNNDLKELNEDVFEKCPELLSVDLSKNNLGRLTEKPFLSLNKLKHLNLYDTFINFARFSNVNKYAKIIHNW